MKKILFVSGVIVAAMSLFLACQKPKNDIMAPPKEDLKTETAHDKIVAFDNDFNIYKSQTKGYSVKIPKETRIQSCASETGYEMVPVTVLNGGKFDYIVPAQYYVSPGTEYYDVSPEEENRCLRVDIDLANAEDWWI